MHYNRIGYAQFVGLCTKKNSQITSKYVMFVMLFCNTPFSRAERKTVFHRKKRGSKRSGRKDRLIQTRVGEQLEQAIKDEAKKRRVTVSHLLRNVLEDCFNLVEGVVEGVVEDVDTVVSDTLDLAHNVAFGAKRSRRSHRYDEFDEQPIDDEADTGEDEEEIESRPLLDDEKANAESVPDRDKIGKNPLDHIYAWNKVVVSQNVSCSICNRPIQKGREGYIGLSDEARRDRSWLCKSCINKL